MVYDLLHSTKANNCYLGGVEMADILNCEEQKLEEEIPGVFYRQYLPLSRQVCGQTDKTDRQTDRLTDR